MPAIAIKSREQYIKMLEVLDRVGGTWQGVGQDERYLLVTLAQCKALVEAAVITPEDAKTEIKFGKNSRKRTRS
jgi:hypothetical protein